MKKDKDQPKTYEPNKSVPAISPLLSNPELKGYGEMTSWLIQPMAVSTMYQSFELSQIRAMLTIIRSMQEPINAVINGADPKGQLELFKQNDFGFDNDVVDGGVVIEMKMRDITSDHSQYKAIREVLQKMSELKVSYLYQNSDGRDLMVVEPFIKKFIIPTGKQRIHSIHVVLSTTIAEMIIRTDGYSWHKILENVILESKYPSTQNLYLYLSAMRAKNHSKEFDVDTSELRKQAGTTKFIYDDENHVIGEKVGYKQWGMFVKNVLDPARDELLSKFNADKSDICFDWSPIYAQGKAKKGEPDAVHIQITAFDEKLLGAEIPVELDFSAAQDIVVNRFGVRINNFANFRKQITTKQQLDAFIAELARIDAEVKGDKRNAKYFYTCCKSALDAIISAPQPVAQVIRVPQADTVSAVPTSKCEQLISALQYEFGNGQMGYDYLFGRKTSCRGGEEQKIIISVPAFGYNLVSSSPQYMDRVGKCVVATFGKDADFILEKIK